MTWSGTRISSDSLPWILTFDDPVRFVLCMLTACTLYSPTSPVAVKRPSEVMSPPEASHRTATATVSPAIVTPWAVNCKVSDCSSRAWSGRTYSLLSCVVESSPSLQDVRNPVSSTAAASDRLLEWLMVTSTPAAN